MREAILHASDAGGTFDEQYGEGERGSFAVGLSDADIETWARALIQEFNNTLRTHETARTLNSVTIREKPNQAAPESHDWHKTNAVTISDRHGVYDRMKCERCGITGKRFGLVNVRLDSEFKARAFETCNGALALLAKRKAKAL